MGSDGRKTYFPQNKMQKREGKAPAYPSLCETTGSANFHSWGNSQMTDLLFYSHRAKEKEKMHQKNKRERGRDGDTERKGRGMKERQQREGGGQAEEGFDLL